MHFTTATAALAAGLTLLSSASAITVTQPDDDTVWSSGTSSQTIAWEAVSTDPDSFQVQLVNQAGFLQNSPVTLIDSQSRGAANVQMSASVSFPNGNWPVGTAFQINLMSTSNNGNGGPAILAQSKKFNITSSGSSGSSGSSVTTGTTSSGTPPQTLAGMQTPSTTTTVVSGTTASGSTASSGNANALPNVGSTTSKANAASELIAAPSTFFATVLGVATFFGVFA